MEAPGVTPPEEMKKSLSLPDLRLPCDKEDKMPREGWTRVYHTRGYGGRDTYIEVFSEGKWVDRKEYKDGGLAFELSLDDPLLPNEKKQGDRRATYWFGPMGYDGIDCFEWNGSEWEKYNSVINT